MLKPIIFMLDLKIAQLPTRFWATNAIFLTPYFWEVFMASKFVISPEPFVQKCKSLAKAKDLYVDVKDGSIRLAWSAISKDGTASKIEHINRAEAVRLGIPYELLLDAVLEAGGTIDGSDHYPVTEEIIHGLRKVGLQK
jgi:hypothetical protein